MIAAEDYTQSPPDEHHLVCLLLSPSGRIYLPNALDDVDPDDFYDPFYGRLWAAARLIHSSGQRVTKRTLLATIDTEPGPKLKLNTEAIRLRLDRITGEPVYTDKLPASIRNVRDMARIRRLIQATDRIRQRIGTAGDYSQALGAAWEELRALEGSETPTEVVPFSTLIDEFHKTMATGPESGQVVPTPWPELNGLLSGGLHPGRSFVVAGRPGSGKSLTGLNCAQTAAEQGFVVLVISAEMSQFEVTGRLLAAGGEAEYAEITRFDMSPDTTRRITEYGETYRDMPLWVIDRSGITIEYIAAVARSMKRTTGLDLIVIDYLQLLDPTERKVIREQQVAHISRSIKRLSRELGCAIITAAQLNRENTKTDRRPTVADLRESGSLEQDADAVILLHHEETTDGRSTGMVTLIVAKSRFGRKDNIDLRWRGHQARIG